MAFMIRGGFGGKALQFRETAIHGLFNGLRLCQQTMMKFKLFVSALVALSVLPLPAAAQRTEQDRVRDDTRVGAVRSLRSIEERVVPGMKARGADYIGAEYDGQSARYRLKFMRGQSVIWVDVDGRSGSVIGKAGE